jgi:hypothetical protein
MYVCSPGSVRQIALPAPARRLSTLECVDYEDAFLVDVHPDQDRTPLEWARAIVEGGPARFRATAPWVWLALGLKHGSARSDDYVLGWEVRRDTAECALLGAESRVGMPAELLVKHEPSALLFATLIRFDSPLMRAVWAGVTPYHQRVVRQLLERAGGRSDRT